MRGPLVNLLILAPLTSFACCGVTPSGQPIEFGKQENIVIYNSKTKTEFFIRNARFKTVSKDFGFIAPTPSAPEIFGVSDEIFTTIDRYFQSFGRGLKEPLTIVNVTNVGGYQATVLKATDSKVLTKWLKDNNYAVSKGITEWLDHYIKKNWYLTAFKIVNQAEVTESGIIGMKFKTEVAFHPYYVPEENSTVDIEGGLNCSLLSDFESVRRSIGPEPTEAPRVVLKDFAAPVDEVDLIKIASLLKVARSELPATAYIQMWKGTPFPTADKDDLYFHPVKSLFSLPRFTM